MDLLSYFFFFCSFFEKKKGGIEFKLNVINLVGVSLCEHEILCVS